jgi:hypothetical protein
MSFREPLGTAFLRCLAGLAFVAVWLCARPCSAFYTRGHFELPAELGGAGRLYYTGSPRERGWDCRACHLSAPGSIRVSFETEPPDLVESGDYVPGTEYTISVTLQNEHRGLSSQFNSNGFVAEFLRGVTPVGELSDSSDTELLQNETVVSSRNETNRLAKWSFRWTAPASGTGPVTVYLGAVDGDGAGRADRSFQDHLNDDVFMGTLRLRERGGEVTGTAGDSLFPVPREPATYWLLALAYALGLAAYTTMPLTGRFRAPLRR